VVGDTLFSHAGFNGKATLVEPPALTDNPYDCTTTFAATDDILFLPWIGSLVDTYTLNKIWFYRGSMTKIPSDPSTYEN
jgi:hypothetical protein